MTEVQLPEGWLDRSLWFTDTVAVTEEVIAPYQPSLVDQVQRRMVEECYAKLREQESEAIAAAFAKTPVEPPQAGDWSITIGGGTPIASGRRKVVPEFDYSEWFKTPPQRMILGADANTPKVVGRYGDARKADALDFCDSYMSDAHYPELLMERAKMLLEGVEYDTLVGTGLSGTLAAPELARKLGKRYLIVRKPNDGSHSYCPFEGSLGKRWVFVDDLVETGKTFARVWDTIEAQAVEERGFETEYVGAMLYSHVNWVPARSATTLGWFSKSESYDGRFGPAQDNSW